VSGLMVARVMMMVVGRHWHGAAVRIGAGYNSQRSVLECRHETGRRQRTNGQ